MSRIARFGLPLLLSLMVAAALAVDAWLVLGDRVNRDVVIALLGLEALLLVGAIWAAAAVLELRVYRPLRQLRDHARLLLHTEVDHRPDVATGHGLGELPECVAALGRELSRERRETARAMEAAAARVDHRKSRLEAILRDLHEGVIVCNDDHRIVLFNQQAAAFLERAGPLGLHRPLDTLLEGEHTRRTYAQLKEQLGRGQERSLLSRFTDRSRDGRDVELRMNLVVEQGECTGYVLTLPGVEPGDGAAKPASLLSDRPEFYDFSLFESRPPPEVLAGRPAELDYVVFDTETTGLDPSHGDAIVQVAGVRLVRGRRTGEEFDTLVNPGIPIPPSSTRFHGITDDMVIDAPSMVRAVRAFHDFAEGAVLVAHNAAFDMKFLRMREREAAVVFDNPVLDTLLLSFTLQPDHGIHTLDAIAARFGVSIVDEVRHTALGDARATAEIFTRMLPALERQGLQTLGEVLAASDRVFHIRRQQEKV